MDTHLHNAPVVAAMLVIYGVAFITRSRNTRIRAAAPGIQNVELIDMRMALMIGLFQVLSLVPGTSRSGATILGGILMGCSRAAASEFSFFLAIPTMAGASLIKVLKFGLSFHVGGAADSGHRLCQRVYCLHYRHQDVHRLHQSGIALPRSAGIGSSSARWWRCTFC